MNRDRAIHVLAMGEKALHYYDGASGAWNAMGQLRTGADALAENAKAVEAIRGGLGTTLAIFAGLTVAALVSGTLSKKGQ